MTEVEDRRPAEEESADLLPERVQDTEPDSDTPEDDELAGLPIDRGWAWVILFAAMLEIFIYGGIMKSLGVFLVQYQIRFRSSTSETVLVQTVANIVVSVSGIFVMNLGLRHMTARTAVCIGSVLTCVSYVIAAFARDIKVLILTIGVLAGVSVTMIYLPILASIGIYFNKRRSLVNSLSAACAPAGALVFGPMFTALFDYYGYTGTMLITGALMLNICISGVLVRPPEFYTQRKKRLQYKELQDMSKTDLKYVSEDGQCPPTTVQMVRQNHTPDAYDDIESYNFERLSKTHNGNLKTDDEPDNFVKRLPHFAAINFQRTRALSYDPDRSSDNQPPSPLVQRPRSGTTYSMRPRYVSDSGNSKPHLINALNDSKVVLCSGMDIMYGSVASVAFNSLIQEDNTLDESDENIMDNSTSTETCITKAKSATIKFLKMVFDTSLLREPIFIHFCFFAIIGLPGSIMTTVYIVPFAKDIGVSNTKVGLILFVVGCVDLVSRVSVGVISDRKLLKPTTIVTVAFVSMAVVNNFARLINTFEGVLAFVVIQACFAGSYMALFAVILIESVGVSKFKSSLGFLTMFHGISVAIFFPLTGMLRDQTGAYYWTYHLLSVMLLLGAALAFTLPMTIRRSQRGQHGVKGQT